MRWSLPEKATHLELLHMHDLFEHIVVIGAGTMGAGIAGQIANAGHRVLLLDLPHKKSSEALADAAMRRLLTSNPPALMHKQVAELIDTGNVRDDFDKLSKADWVVEAVVERVDVKRNLYQRLAGVIPSSCIVTSNTSTIPISLLVEGMPEAFQQNFAITHYFNPVRYMRLLELVGGKRTLPVVIDRLAEFNDRELGKGVVRCSDTPGFLGNRVGVFALQVGIDETLRQGLRIETADALMGRPMGIPKTGIFGLYDLIGIDLMADVVHSLRSTLPIDDAFQAVGAESTMINAMIEAGLTGKKSGAGFYRTDNDAQPLSRNLQTGLYSPLCGKLPLRAQAAAQTLAMQQEPLTRLITGDDAQARFCRNVLGRVLGYAAGLLGDVTDSAQAIDDAMKLGFNWIRGPFEMIDALGAQTVADLLAATGAGVPAALGNPKPFYQVQAGVLRIRQTDGNTAPLLLPEGALRWHLQRRTLTPLATNNSASLYAIENDFRLIEFHSKANALNDASMQIVKAAVEDHGNGILIHNDAQHYSAGVDLNAFLTMIDAADWAGIDAFLLRFQQAVKSLKYAPVAVVGAPTGLALGGGFEVLLHCDSLVVHSNSVLGLVEAAVGLVPSGGGIKETYRRWHSHTGDWQQAAWNTWKNIGYGATGSSPKLAARLGYYRPEIDIELMNRDYLYRTAVEQLRLQSTDYEPAPMPAFKLAGGDIIERMTAFMDDGIARGEFFPHDKTVAMQIATVVCCDHAQGLPISEDELLQRERAAFLRLAKTPQTRARIHHLLHNRSTLRN